LDTRLQCLKHQTEQQLLKVILNSKAPRSAKEMFLAEPTPNIDNVKTINKLTHQQLKELGLTIDVDVTDCKNFKDASKVQEQIVNGDVKINIIKKN